MNRVFGAVVTVAWLVAMTALIQRDVVPFWSVQEAPVQRVPDGTVQVAVENEAGVRIGTTWVKTTRTPSLTTVRSTTLLDLRVIPSLDRAGSPKLLETALGYLPDGTLDQFHFELKGAGSPIEVNGERCGRDFACTTRLGSLTRTIPMDGRLSESLAETLRPFTHLEDLHVGQRWRVRLLDSSSLLWGHRPEFKLQLASVTAKEPIRHHGGVIECFRIETEGAVAWADDTGRVVRQKVRLPLLGWWFLTDEPFDREALAAAQGAFDRRLSAVGENSGPDG